MDHVIDIVIIWDGEDGCCQTMELVLVVFGYCVFDKDMVLGPATAAFEIVWGLVWYDTLGRRCQEGCGEG